MNTEFIELLTAKNLSRFNSLNTFKEKIEFWDNILGIKYINYLEYFNDYTSICTNEIVNKKKNIEQIFKFKIDVEKKEWENFNLWILENYENDKKNEDSRELLKFEKLKKDFNKQLRLSKNIEQIIYSELEIIETSFQSFTSAPIPLLGSSIAYYNFKFDADYQSYIDYYKYRKEPNFNDIMPGLNIINIANGKELALYHLFIEEQLLKLKTGKLELAKKEELQVKEVALLLHLCGFLEGPGDTINKAKVLHSLLGIGQKSLYDAFRDVNLPAIRKNKNYLNNILDYLEEHNVKEYKKQIQEELKKLN